MSKRVYFFAGSNSYKGFYSYFEYIANPKYAKRIFILKGGPGTGKSTFMKKMADYFLQKGYDVEFFPCSSDIYSLDAISIKNLGLAFVDGTSPHVIDPVLPGVVDEIINLGDYLDDSYLSRHRDEIIKTNEKIAFDFKMAYSFLNNAKRLKDLRYGIERRYLSDGYIIKTADKLCNELFNDFKVAYKKGNVRRLFLSAITPQGFQSFIGEYSNNFDKIYKINTNLDIASLAIEKIKIYAVERGFDAEVFFCALDPKKPEHIAIPELSFFVATSNSYHAFLNTRFVDIDIEIERISDDDKRYIKIIESEVYDNINKAISFLRSAKENHDQLEKFYIDAMDFKGVDEKWQQVLKKIDRIFLI